MPDIKAKGVLHGIRIGRKRELQLHRAMVFGEVFDDYRAGKVPASYVTYRAKKMLEIGLPESWKRF